MTFRLTTWNCKGAFRHKQTAVEALAPDILILPEAGKLNEVSRPPDSPPVNSTEWIGGNVHKGLGVISYGDFKLDVHESFDPTLRWILPLRVTGPQTFTLFAVWTIKATPNDFYIASLFGLCEKYRPILEDGRVVIAGDLNQNVIFDKPRSQFKYSRLLEIFSGFGLTSLYHKNRGCAQGEEPEPTFFLYHKAERPYHLDHIFATEDLHQNNFDITVGAHKDWRTLSDHMPVTCDFSI